MPYFTILIISVFAAFFWRAAEFENASALLWGGLSLTISMVMLLLIHAGLIGIILGQVGLFAGITLFRVLRKS
ncbi:MAG TPA: hypothetical protein VMB22_00230 [Verrucomicrobiae bacterium]|nr:hypothetical protein [Verrucomicrobiae bacterium]